MDTEILNLYIKPDIKENIPYTFLYNSEYSYKIFIKNLSNIFTRKILLKNDLNSSYYLIFKDYSISISHNSYLESLFESKPYELIIEYSVIIEKEIIDNNGNIKTIEINAKKQNTIQKIKIPAYVCYNGMSPLGTNNIIDEFTKGGFFIVNKGMKKFMTNKRDSINTSPKYKKEDKASHISFNSIPIRYELNKFKVQYLTLKLVISDKMIFDIQSKKTFLKCNIILLLLKLLQMQTTEEFLVNKKKENILPTLQDIKNIILLPFNENIKNNSEIIFYKTEDLFINNYNGNINEYFYKKTLEFSNNYNTETTEISNIFNNFIKNFLPHLSTLSDKIYFIISIIRQFLIIINQNEIYPHRDHLAVKRVAPIGYMFEEIIITNLNNMIKDIKDKFLKNDNSEITLSEINFQSKITNIFSNIFNMKDSKYSKTIKNSTTITCQNDVLIPNLVTHGSKIKLTKNLNARNNEISSIGFEDNIDTPDHSESVGLVKRIAILTRITYYTFEEHKNLFENLKQFIMEQVNYVVDYNKPILCSIIDQSEYPITFLTEDEVDKLIILLKKYKRYNFNNFRYIGIERIPDYIFDNARQHYVPLKNCIQLKLNISCKRYYKPYFIVNDGIAELSKLKLEDIKKYNNFSDFILEYPNIIEYLDPGQVTYSNICINYETFNNLSNTEKKLYDYIEFPATSNFGLLTSTTFDLGRMPGARATFATAQQKQVLTQMVGNSYNKYEGGSALLNPYERPCITNNILEESKLSILGRGQHVIVGFFSYINNIEDALIFRKSTVDRGLLDAITLNTYKDVLLDLEIRVPTPIKTNNNYSKLNESGLPSPLTVLNKGDAYHKKITTMFKDENSYSYDISEAYNNLISSRVERIEKTGSDNININILLSSYRPLKVGDKLSNQCAQKGTIGIFLEDHELPCTEDGLIPDIIINSTSIISRQTYPLFILGILTKLFANFPTDSNGDLLYREYLPFTNINIDTFIKNIINEYKTKMPNINDDDLLNKVYGEENMYDIYGNKYEEKMTIFPLMYSRLSQMSSEKIAYRNRGKLDKLGVPIGGRKRNGGQRNGEMEMDNLCAHGVSNILYENTTDVVSNNVSTNICNRCSSMATCEKVNGLTRWFCLNCENAKFITDITNIKVTQAFKIWKENYLAKGVNILLKKKEQKIWYPKNKNN